MRVWLMTDGHGVIHGPFRDLAAVKDYPRQVEPVVLLHVEDDAEGPEFLIAGDALCEAMNAIIFKNGTDRRAEFQGGVNWG